MAKKGNPFLGKKASFVKQLYGAACEAGRAFELNPAMILSQAAIETGWGDSGYAKRGNNYFGIIACGKPNAYWKGAKSSVNSNGLCFRKYATATDGFMDYGRLLRVQYPRAAEKSYFPAAFAQEISYSAYISEKNGDNREHYRKMLISIEADIRDIVAEHGLDLPFDNDAKVDTASYVERKALWNEKDEVFA
ncbi:MAG: glucosaminidase domain-containing protein [Tannerellaceae bacterium]